MSNFSKLLHQTLKFSAKATIKFVVSYAKIVAISIVKLLPNSFKNVVVPSSYKSYKDLNYIVLYPKMISRRQLPKTVHENIYYRFFERIENDSTESFVLCLEEGISTSSGANLTKSGILIDEVSKQVGLSKQNVEKHLIFSSAKVICFKRYNNYIATLTTSHQSSYFHWLFNVLPKFHLLEKSGIGYDKIYIEVKNKFQKETIKILGYDNEKLINSSVCKFLSAPNLIVPSLPDYDNVCNITAWTCEFLRQSFLNYNFQSLNPCLRKYKRIYISRADATRRKISNEFEIISFLQRYEFSVVKLECLSFLEQVDIFRNVEVVVAPHGGGLSNLVFCSEKTKIIEIFSPNYIVLCYWFLSQHIGLDYYYLLGEGELPTHFDARFTSDNIEVDLNKLRKTLELAVVDL